MQAKKWNIFVLAGAGCILLLLSLFTIVIDPFFHFHKPLEFLEYPMKDERYQNDGIARWFEYDAIITGTSMTQNFKTSEFDEYMGVTSVKIPYAGATFHELGRNMRRALEYRPDTRMILCSLDSNYMIWETETDGYEGVPKYLYDDNPFNDVKYVLNKEVIPKTLAVINYTRAGGKTPTMDEYSFWGDYVTYGREQVLASQRVFETANGQSVSLEDTILTGEDKEIIRENCEKNYVQLARDYPETQFIFHIPPYSIVSWRAAYHNNQVDAEVDKLKYAVEIMLQAENIQVYCFADRLDISDNLDNYKDSLHYSPEINSEILRAIAAGEGRLTRENYQEYFERVRKIYTEYDYSGL